MSSKPPTRVVFVGNIPYGLSEEQITDLFSSAGQVLNFRLVYDRETGRPKGFGFAEYPDSDSAASAVRNLNDHEVMGRKLRVDFSNEGGAAGNDDGPSHGGNQPSNNYNAGGPVNSGDVPLGGPLPPLPPGVTLPQGVSVTDHISRTLNTLPPTQLLDILTSFKQLCATDPMRATELLTQAPQLSYAIFQALLLMGLVSPEAINAVLEPGSVPPPAAGGYPGMTQTPPVVHGGYAPPPVGVPTPVVQHPVAPPAAAPAQDSDALIQQVLSLPEEVIAQLPEAERVQIMQLRAQFGMSRA
ncbi:hypothetical protein BD289DRAFT_361124 [Coniella lustricola]|uniref:RRM domain-containing protein n=1 Tax=Coniella lustricola TaxID=2025994 RepID=A0A2T3AIS4_9PEZI|nr:hypothetical protein BD289DRAFT_361124 [Coniella lustricola]